MTASHTPKNGTIENIKARELRPVWTRLPRKPTLVGHPRWPFLLILASGPHVATSWRHDASESGGTKLHRAPREFVLEEYRVGCFASALV